MQNLFGSQTFSFREKHNLDRIFVYLREDEEVTSGLIKMKKKKNLSCFKPAARIELAAFRL